MEFITFHVALSADQAVHPNQTVAHAEYLGMVDMMFSSARLFHPHARRVVLSDLETSFDPVRDGIDSIDRSEMDPQKLMFERAQAQLRHVRASGFDRPMVIIDSDILVNGSLQPVFERDFDVALTWRGDNRDQPINGGLLILNNRRPAVSRRFFENYVRIYSERYADEKGDWFGDQLALRDALGLEVEQLAASEIVEVDGCRVLLLPCDTYNFSPSNQFTEIERDLGDKLILHFKGERKRLMRPYWRARLQPAHSWLPWVKFRGWREREWLRRQCSLEGRPARAAGSGA